TRVWIIGKEILTHEGILYRSSHEWEKLIKAFEYEKSQFIPKELLKWEPVDIHGWMEGGYYHSSAPIPSQELKAEYNELEKFLGVESIVWNAPIDPAPKHIHIDLRGAYLGSVCCLTSVVQLVAWEFAKNLHPFTAELIGQHLTEKEGWIPTPLIDYLLSAGWLISATPREIIYSIGKKSRIEFPSDRDLAIRFVGSCACNAQVTYVLIRNKNEADMIHQWLARKKLCTDAIYTTTIPETVLDESKLSINFDESFYTNVKNDIELEEWRKKKPGYIYRKETSSWIINHKGSLEFPPSEAPPLSTDPKLITLRKLYLVDQEGLTAMIYHKYFHLGATAIDEWDPACLGKKTLAEILIFDEVCMIPRKVLQRLLSYAESRGCQIIMCGDPGQLIPWGDKEEDYCAQDDKLKTLKLRMWIKNDLAQLLEFHKAISKTIWKNALAHALLQAHASHFPNEFSVIRFDPDDNIKHKYCIQGKPKYASWGTVHRIQGQTIEAPECYFIVDHSLRGWINNAVYTACNRVRYMNQLILEDWEVDNKSDLMEDSTVCEKPLFLAENDEENVIPSLTVKDVIEIATRQDKCCKVCRVPLLFQGYPKHHPQSFSVDRLDDAEGHYRQNVRITCLRCNERHRH
ncbi:6055_t:CDS:10, partial [Diversispora eburnea]